MCGVVSILIIIQKLLARWGFSGHSLEHGTVWKIFLERLTPTQLDLLYSSPKWKFSLSLPMWIAFHVNFITLTWPNISGRQENWGWDVSTVVTRVLTVGGTRYWLYTSSFHYWCCWCHIYIKGIDLETQVQFYGRLDTYRVYDQNTNNSEQFYHVNPQYFFNLSD